MHVSYETQTNTRNLLFTAAEPKADSLEPPVLARVPLPSGALAAVAAQLKQYITAREQCLLAEADKAATAAPAAATDDQLAQQWQVRHRVCTLTFTRLDLTWARCTFVKQQTSSLTETQQ